MSHLSELYLNQVMVSAQGYSVAGAEHNKFEPISDPPDRLDIINRFNGTLITCTISLQNVTVDSDMPVGFRHRSGKRVI